MTTHSIGAEMTIVRRTSLISAALILAACGGPASEARKTQTTLAPSAPEGAATLNVETLAEGLVNP
jgi:hypothetical protein